MGNIASSKELTLNYYKVCGLEITFIACMRFLAAAKRTHIKINGLNKRKENDFLGLVT